MGVGNSVRIAIKLHGDGETEAAMRRACAAAGGSAAKVYPALNGNNARSTALLGDNYFILEPIAAPGVDLDETRFPVKVEQPKALGGQPDFADVIYGIHGCCHGHGEALSGGYELIPARPDCMAAPGRTSRRKRP